jgi:hypothetical protein
MPIYHLWENGAVFPSRHFGYYSSSARGLFTG